MPLFRVHDERWFRAGLASVLALTVTVQPILVFAQDKPTGAPLVLSGIETEQAVPLAILLPDGKTAKCVPIRLHWDPNPNIGPTDEATSFTLDLPADNPAAPIFTAQLWNASLASAMAWQQPWQGARWKVLDTPVSDGSGIDAALAVGMIATSARRPYPPKTVVIGSLNPDGSLGPVSHMIDRLDAAAEAGMKRVIIPSSQRFDTNSKGQVINLVRHASELKLECVPVDDLVGATQATMNDPLPAAALDTSVPKYSNDVATYIDDFAHREQTEATSGLGYAPKESELSTFPPRLAAIWKSIYADVESGQEAYQAGEVYVAYQLFTRANGRMNGATALAGQSTTDFDVKAALAEADDLHDHLHVLMNPPSIDRGGLESAVLVAEMADWAYNIDAALEGAELVTKQAFSQRSDASAAERDRAREAILFANAECKYLLTQADFYTGLLPHISQNNPITVDENAANLLPQLIPAQLATARSFTEGIRASDLRDGLLFDPRLVAYVNVLREIKADWDTRQNKKKMDSAAPPSASVSGTNSDNAPVKPDANDSAASVGFNPGNTYLPPETALSSTPTTKKLSDVALCLIWVDHDCEIATLDEKYLRLTGTMDPATHEWHVKDRAKLDALIQTAETGARRGIAFAEKAELDPSVLAMIYERAAHQRDQNDDASALDALRNYWRCALLGNVCWQLAHTHKAEPVELGTAPPAAGTATPKSDGKGPAAPHVAKDNGAANNHGATATVATPAASTNEAVVVSAPGESTASHEIVTPVAPPAATNTVVVVSPPVAPMATPPDVTPTPAPVVVDPPVAPIATNQDVAPAPPAPPNASVAAEPPVAPIATNMDVSPAPPVETNAGPVVEPPVAPIATNQLVVPAPPAPAAPAPTTVSDDEMNIPVAPVAKVEDYAGGGNGPATNAAPATGPIPPSKSDNADAHSF